MTRPTLHHIASRRLQGFAGIQRTISVVSGWTIGDDWAPHRVWLYHLIHSRRLDVLVALVTVVNLCIVVLQTDIQADGEQDEPVWIQSVALVTISLFILESICRIYVHRLQVVAHQFYILDIVVSAVDLLTILFRSVIDFVPMLSLLRFWRIVRLGQVALRMDQFRELYLMISGLRAAMKALVWASVIIGATLVFCAIFAVQIIHPLNKEVADKGLYAGCDRCPQAFASVWQATLTFIQQIIAGDSWGLVTLRVIDAYPLSAAFFFPAFLTIDLALMNLVLMVVVDQAEEARASDAKRALIDKENAMHAAKHALYELCEEMDDDKNGSLTLQELMTGANCNEAFKDILKLMDIDVSDLETVFAILDADESGTVEYAEFCDQLHKMKTDDAHTMLVIMRHQLKQVMVDMKKDIQLHQRELTFHQEELKLLQTDYKQIFLHQEKLLEKIVMHLDGKPLDTMASLSSPEGKVSADLSKASNLTAQTPLQDMSMSAFGRQLLDGSRTTLEKEIRHLKAWISKEITPILQDELAPALHDVKQKLNFAMGSPSSALLATPLSTSSPPWASVGSKLPSRIIPVAFDDASTLQNVISASVDAKRVREEKMSSDEAYALEHLRSPKKL